jgi:Domain of unknown function (DUF4112)
MPTKRDALVGDRGDPPAADVLFAVRMADWLDDRYVDPLMGLVLPVAGDLVLTAVGIYPIVVALRRRMPAIVVARMIRNVAIDLLFGAIPLFGDVFDFVFKAHRRNANLLLERHVAGPSPWRDWSAVLGAILMLFLALSVPLALAVLAIARFG